MDELHAGIALRHIAAVQQQISAGRQRLAPTTQAVRQAVELLVIERLVAQPQRTAASMTEHMNGRQALVGIQNLADLQRAVPAGVEHDHEGVQRGRAGCNRRAAQRGGEPTRINPFRPRLRRRREQVRKQCRVIAQRRIDENDLARRRLSGDKGGQRQARQLAGKDPPTQRAGDHRRVLFNEGVAPLAWQQRHRAGDMNSGDASGGGVGVGGVSQGHAEAAVGMGRVAQVLRQCREVERVGALAGADVEAAGRQCLHEPEHIVARPADEFGDVASPQLVDTVADADRAVGGDLERQSGGDGGEIERPALGTGGVAQLDLAPAIDKAQRRLHGVGRCLEGLGQRPQQMADCGAAGTDAELQRRRQGEGILLLILRRNDRQLGRQQHARLQRLEHRLAPSGSARRGAPWRLQGVRDRGHQGAFIEGLH